MIHEVICGIQDRIETLLYTHEVPFKSVRVAHFYQASYFAFDGSFVYVIVDCDFSGAYKFCYVGETTNLGTNLRKHARNHQFSHAFVVDLGDTEKAMREFVKDLLVDQLDPIFQGIYNPFEIYRSNNFERELETRDVMKWKEMITVKMR